MPRPDAPADATAPASDADFDTLDLPRPLHAALDGLGFVAPTPVQAAALPPLLAGRDVVVRARTGSGKTLAYGLPLLARLDPARRLQALVLVPTRELGAQVTATLRTLGRRLPGLRVLAISGGQPRAPQQRALAEGVHVVVGTPGRVLDLLGGGALDPGGVRTLVLDEADRLLDLGFQADVEVVLAALPADRLTALVSATFPPALAALGARWQRDPVTVSVDEAPPPSVRHVVHVVEAGRKADALRAVLAAAPTATALVFCNLKRVAGEVAEALGAGALHGDLSQEERDLLLARLRNGSVRVLVATDVASRGLDVDGLDLVVNLDPPTDAETWVHRAGRTGRMGREGVVVSLVTPEEDARVDALAGAPLERAPVPAATAAPAPPERVTLRIGGGRRDKLRPGDVLGALTGDAGLAAADVGRIEIGERVSYVAVARDKARQAVVRLGRSGIKGRRLRVERVD
jgi:ATP-independent RNA helicase DbpA